MKAKRTATTAANLEARFDAGEDVLDLFDAATATRPNRARNRINLDLPVWVVRRMDRLSGRNGVPRQSMLKQWLVERLREEEKAS